MYICSARWGYAARRVPLFLAYIDYQALTRQNACTWPTKYRGISSLKCGLVFKVPRHRRYRSAACRDEARFRLWRGAGMLNPPRPSFCHFARFSARKVTNGKNGSAALKLRLQMCRAVRGTIAFYRTALRVSLHAVRRSGVSLRKCAGRGFSVPTVRRIAG